MRYADDFVILCRSSHQAQGALATVEKLLAERLGLSLSPEKTKVTTFMGGFSFLGFDISSRSVRMSAKAAEKFKMKIRDLTIRCHNLDAEVVNKLNQVIRGTANYFATPFSKSVRIFRTLDRWIRMRIRCMKSKRKSRFDNLKIRVKHLSRLGLFGLSDYIVRPV